MVEWARGGPQSLLLVVVACDCFEVRVGLGLYRRVVYACSSSCSGRRQVAGRGFGAAFLSAGLLGVSAMGGRLLIGCSSFDFISSALVRGLGSLDTGLGL